MTEEAVVFDIAAFAGRRPMAVQISLPKLVAVVVNEQGRWVVAAEVSDLLEAEGIALQKAHVAMTLKRLASAGSLEQRRRARRVEYRARAW